MAPADPSLLSNPSLSAQPDDAPPTLSATTLVHGFRGDVSWAFAHRPPERLLVELLGGHPLQTLREIAY